MSGGDQLYIFAAVAVKGTEVIDGGRTLAIRLQKADGDEAVLLLSLPLAEDLNRQIATALVRGLE